MHWPEAVGARIDRFRQKAMKACRITGADLNPAVDLSVDLLVGSRNLLAGECQERGEIASSACSAEESVEWWRRAI